MGEFVLVAAELVLAEHERQAFLIDAVEGEGEGQTAFDAAEHGEQLGPVLQDARLHAAAALVGHSAQDFGVAHGEACLHLRPLFLHVERVAGAAEALYVLQFGEAGALFVGEDGLREHEEDAAVEEGDVERGHFLTADDHAALHEGHLSVLVVRAAHLHAAYSVVRALHELQYLGLHVLVLVLVEVDHGVHRIPRLLVQAGERGVAEVWRTVAGGEEGHERGTAVAFARTLRAEEVEDGEGGGAALYDVAEAGGEPVEQPHAAVLPPDAAELLHVVGEGDVVEGAVGEAALQAVGPLAFVFGVEGVGGHWQEEALGGLAFFCAAHDAVGVRTHKLPVGVHAVAEHVEALAAVVAHLVDDGGGFGLFVEVGLQLQHVVLVALEEVVAHAFEFLAEALEAVEVVHVEDEQLFRAPLVAQFEEAEGLFLAADVEEGTEGEVAPLYFALVREAVVAAAVLGEAVFSQVYLLRTLLLRVDACPFGAVDVGPPELLALAELDEFVENHVRAGLVRDEGRELGDLAHGVALLVDVPVLVPQLACGPADKLHLLEGGHHFGAGEVTVGVLLGVPFAHGYLADGDRETHLQCLAAVLQHEADARAPALASGDGVGIVEEADGAGGLGQRLQLFARPLAAQRGHGVVEAEGVELHGVGRAFDQEPLVLLQRSAPADVDAEDVLALGVGGAFSRVEVLGLALPGHVAGGEAHGAPLLVAYGHHETAAVEVVDGASLFVLAQQAELEEEVGVFAPLPRPLVEGTAGGGGVAHTGLFHVFFAPAVLGVLAGGDGRGVGVVVEAFGVEAGHAVVQAEQGLALQAALPLGVGLGFFVEVHAVLLGELAHGIDEGEAVPLHDVRKHVPAFLTRAEAVPRLARGVHVEAGRALGVEGAAGHVARSPLLQPNAALLHHAHDVGALQHGLYGCLTYHLAPRLFVEEVLWQHSKHADQTAYHQQHRRRVVGRQGQEVAHVRPRRAAYIDRTEEEIPPAHVHAGQNGPRRTAQNCCICPVPFLCMLVVRFHVLIYLVVCRCSAACLQNVISSLYFGIYLTFQLLALIERSLALGAEVLFLLVPHALNEAEELVCSFATHFACVSLSLSLSSGRRTWRK